MMNSCLNKSFPLLITHPLELQYEKPNYPQISCNLVRKCWHPLAKVPKSYFSEPSSHCLHRAYLQTFITLLPTKDCWMLKNIIEQKNMPHYKFNVPCHFYLGLCLVLNIFHFGIKFKMNPRPELFVALSLKFQDKSATTIKQKSKLWYKEMTVQCMFQSKTMPGN